MLCVKAELQVVELEMKSTFPQQVWCCIGKKGEDKVLGGIVTRGPRTLKISGDFHDPQVLDGR